MYSYAHPYINTHSYVCTYVHTNVHYTGTYKHALSTHAQSFGINAILYYKIQFGNFHSISYGDGSLLKVQIGSLVRYLCPCSEWSELASFPTLVIRLSRLMSNESHVAPSSSVMWVVIVLTTAAAATL